MYSETKAIILNQVKYNENQFIVNAFTKEYGAMGFFHRKSTKQKNLINYLSICDVSFNERTKGDIHSIKEINIHYPYKTIYNDIYKLNVAMFLTEVLSKTIKQEGKNELLFTFLEEHFIHFDKESFNKNFYLWFMVQLTKYLGVAPNLQHNHFKYLSVEKAELTNYINSKSAFFSNDSTELLKKIIAISIGEFNQLSINHKLRKNLLYDLIDYYKYHLGISNLKSLPVLEELFSDS